MKKTTLFASLVICILSMPTFARYSGGTGEPNTPYLISTPEDMNAIGANSADWDKHFRLTNDIDMADYTYTTALIAPDTSGSSGFQGTKFTGVFDGADFKVINLTIDTAGSDNDYLGLFGYMYSPAELRNLGVEDVNITGGNESLVLGGLAGWNEGTISDCFSIGSVTGGNDSGLLGGLVGYNRGTISDCFSTGSVTSGYDCLGGLVGFNRYGTISNCYSTGSVTGEDNCLGGLVGYNVDGTISNCFSTASLTGGDNSRDLGGLVGGNGNGTIINCYAAGSVTGGDNSRDLGGLVGENLGTESTIINCYSTGHVTGGNDSYSFGGLLGSNGDGTISNCFSTGQVTGGNGSFWFGGLLGRNSGTISNCFWDVNTSGLDTSAGGIGKTTIQMQTMSTFTDAGWDFLGESLNGTSDFWIIQPENYPQLYTFSESFEPHQFQGSGTVNDPYQIFDANDLGAVYQDAGASYILTNDINLAEITFPTAVVPYFNGHFDGNGFVISNLTISGGGYLGLFGFLAPAGTLEAIGIEDVCITGSDGSKYLGGLIGFNRGTISDCFSTGQVTGGDDSNRLGGLVGCNYNGTIRNCYSTGVVTGGDNSYVLGGLVGENHHLAWTGENFGTISNCYSTSQLNGENSLGGLVGRNSGTISNCYSTSQLNGENSLGGLVAGNFGTIENSYATGQVTGGRCLGGLVADNEGTISDCFSTGLVIAGNESYWLGGLVGFNYVGTISNCYATGQVTGGYGSDYLGGLVGENRYHGTISNCFSTGSVTAGNNSGHLGGLVGASYKTISNCFWDVNTSGLTHSSGGIGKTTEQMQTMSTFTDAGWDFTTPIWKICETADYPRLAWQKIPAPVLYPEPDITTGTENTIAWQEVNEAVEYYAICCNDPNLQEVIMDTGWLDTNEVTFAGLDIGRTYYYAVKARQNCVMESDFSNVESSMQVAPIRADLRIYPKTIVRHSRAKWIFAVIKLPPRIRPSAINWQRPLLLLPGRIEAIWKHVFRRGRGKDKCIYILAVFDKSQLMQAVPQNGPMPVRVVGFLKNGRRFISRDTIRIISPRQGPKLKPGK